MEYQQFSQKCMICDEWLLAGQDIISDARPNQHYLHQVHKTCLDQEAPKPIIHEFWMPRRSL